MRVASIVTPRGASTGRKILTKASAAVSRKPSTLRARPTTVTKRMGPVVVDTMPLSA